MQRRGEMVRGGSASFAEVPDRHDTRTYHAGVLSAEGEGHQDFRLERLRGLVDEDVGEGGAVGRPTQVLEA